MNLEIRTEDGVCIADIKNELGDKVFLDLVKSKRIIESSKNIKGKGKTVVYEVIENCKIQITTDFTVWLFEGTYIKLL